ncbi:MAG: GDP-mannose mannosyl hydrolase [Bacteroidales bacterium]|jgi:colanic acid biosynthesis protein WcaH|nr:GDP-mannose mannosyl hydrolase [Bacteroidales bacterium]
MTDTNVLNEYEFIQLIKNGPLISIDLIVRNKNGEALLGYRKNGPARNMWFVPGGRIRKNERLDDAFKRITFGELSQEIDRRNARFVDIYEHFYENENRFLLQDLDTHYVVLAYLIDNFNNFRIKENDQHSEFRWMTVHELLDNKEVHVNTKNYFNRISSPQVCKQA